MKYAHRSWGWAIALALLPAALFAETPADGEAAARVPVLVELFTSEGCSSCPPADDYLDQLQRLQPVAGVEIIALGQHVDYWDDLGWKDPFANSRYSDRQRGYAVVFGSDRIYTPQMIVDGVDEFVGSERGKALLAIRRAAKRDKTQLALRITDQSATEVDVELQLAPLPERQGTVDIWIAVAEDGLQSAVSRGENRGRTLAHGAVARSLQKVATLEAEHTDSFTGRSTVALDSEWNRDGLRLVAFVQHPLSREMLAVATLAVVQ